MFSVCVSRLFGEPGIVLAEGMVGRVPFRNDIKDDGETEDYSFIIEGLFEKLIGSYVCKHLYLGHWQICYKV